MHNPAGFADRPCMCWGAKTHGIGSHSTAPTHYAFKLDSRGSTMTFIAWVADPVPRFSTIKRFDESGIASDDIAFAFINKPNAEKFKNIATILRFPSFATIVGVEKTPR